MKYPVKRWKTARGFFYLMIDGGKNTVNKFVRELLSAVDPITLHAEEKNLKKREEERAVFFEGEKVTVVVIENSVFIKPENEDDVLSVIQSMIELPEFRGIGKKKFT